MTKARELAKLGEVMTNSQIGGRRNIVINGAMQIFQRGTSFAQSAGATTYSHSADRFRYEENIEQWAGTMSQSTDTPASEQFQYSLKTLTTAVETTIDADDYLQHTYYVEVNDGAKIGFGKSSCNVSTLSFWVKSSLSGLYCVNISNDDGSQTLPLEYTINSADTWEKKILTVPARTSGTWATTGNAKFIGIRWLLGKAGSSYNGGTNGTWSDDTSWAKMYSGSTFVDWSRTASSEFYLTGVQYEIGSVATPFEHRAVGEELSLCQRYYYQTVGSFYSGQDNTGAHRNWFTFPVRMRTSPSITNPNVTGGTIATITTNQDAHTYEASANRPGLATSSPFKASAEL